MRERDESGRRRVVSGVVMATVIAGAAVAVPVLAVEIHDVSTSAGAQGSTTSTSGSVVGSATSSAPDAVSRGS